MIKAKAHEPGLQSVHLHGQQSQAHCQESLAGSQFLVMASRWYEGFPRVIVEAYACGRPVVVPCFGGLVAVVDDGVTGLLYRHEDAADLAAKVRWLTERTEEIRRMGENALQAYRSRYTPEVNYNQLRMVYAQAMSFKKSALLKTANETT